MGYGEEIYIKCAWCSAAPGQKCFKTITPKESLPDSHQTRKQDWDKINELLIEPRKILGEDFNLQIKTEKEKKQQDFDRENVKKLLKGLQDFFDWYSHGKSTHNDYTREVENLAKVLMKTGAVKDDH